MPQMDDRGPRSNPKMTTATQTPIFVFQQLAEVPSSLDSHGDSVHGDAIGLKSYFTDAEFWHLHLSMFLTSKQCVVETEEMPVV